MRILTAIYCLFVGFSILCMWTVTLFFGEVSEGTMEITFHLISEFVMALLLIVSGICLLRKAKAADHMVLLSMGFLLYSVLNAAGYYLERSGYVMTGMFLALFFLSAIIAGNSLRTIVKNK